MSTAVNIPVLARDAKDRLALVKASDGRLWRYGAGVYLPDGMQEAEEYLLGELGMEARAAHVHELRTLLNSGRVGMDLSAANDPAYLNLRNGLYEWATGRLHPHSSDWFTTYQVPHYYVAGATCPGIDAFLDRALPAEADRALFWQWAGYMLRPGNSLKRALILHGRGDTGKSVALHILKSLLGAENVSAQSLQAISDQRFALASLVGKMANIADDLSNTGVKESGTFKKIVGGLDVSCERKGQDPFDYCVGAKLVFSANDLPGTGDMSDAYFRRWHILTFDQYVRPEDQDPGIFEALTQPGEMEGALQRAIAGYPSTGFTVPQGVTDTVSAFQEDADSVFGWLRQECQVGGGFTSRGDAYAAFIRWAEGERRGVMKAPLFYRRLKAADVEETARKGVRGFRLLTVPAPDERF